MKTKQELQANLDAAQKALDEANHALARYSESDDIGRYLVGHIDDLDIANRVLAVFRRAGISPLQDTCNSLDDAQWLGALRRGGYWYNASNAGLFYANLNYDPTNTYLYIGFRCVARPASAVEIISAETFLRRFEDEKANT